MAYLQSGGPLTIFGSTVVGAGAWTRIHPDIRNVTIQATLLGSSVGALVSGAIAIEVSNDGVNPISPPAGTITMSSIASPAVGGFSIDAHYEWIRGNTSSLSTANTSGTTGFTVVAAACAAN